MVFPSYGTRSVDIDWFKLVETHVWYRTSERANWPVRPASQTAKKQPAGPSLEANAKVPFFRIRTKWQRQRKRRNNKGKIERSQNRVNLRSSCFEPFIKTGFLIIFFRINISESLI